MATLSSISVYYVTFHAFRFALCGLSSDERRLIIHNYVDVDILQDDLEDGCRVEILKINYIPDFLLTPDHVEVLQHCPLKEMDLDSCLSPSLRDLSTLTELETLDLDDCRRRNFTITRLPATLEILRINSLTEDNFQLDSEDGNFGESMKELHVSKVSMCSPETALDMFGSSLSGVECFVKGLHIVIGQTCRSSVFEATKDPNFILTPDDVQVLQECPLERMNLAETSCLSSSIGDLSKLTSLERLDLDYCEQNTFTITGLPDSLQILSIEGLTENNFQILNIDSSFGESMKELYVSERYMCSPEIKSKMFGRNLSEIECFAEGELVEVGSGCKETVDVRFDHSSEELVTIKCGLSEDGKTLSIMRTSDELILRHKLTHDCHLNRLFVELHSFVLTQEDVDILSRCPLTEIYLIHSKCFLGSSIDLAKLKNLTHFRVDFCRSSDFVITRLPASLRAMKISGLAEFNIRLRDEVDGGQRFGDSLVSLGLYNAAMCCNNTLLKMFSRDLSPLCRGLRTTQCGLSHDGVYLEVDSRQLLHSYTQQLADDCDVNHFHAAGSEMFLTQEDIDVLALCPLLEDMFLPYTSCFSGSVNLSGLGSLERLFLPFCRNYAFVITGFPPTLKKLDIRGMQWDSIDLHISGNAFLASLQQIEASTDTSCTCPQGVIKLFGKPLSGNTTCGVTESIYSASNYNNDVAFITDGFNSAISSCENLIADPVLKVLMWVMAVQATCGNTAVLVYRVVWDRHNFHTSHSVYPFNLAISDLCMGVYLFIIAVHDLQFKGEYALFDEEWRHGPLCHLAGFLSTLSSETSAIFILLITVDRFLTIQFPFGQFRSSLKLAWILCGTAWGVGLIIASLPLVISGWEVYSFNSICVGLPLHSDAYTGSDYATGVFIGLNSFLFAMIAVGQVLIYRANWVNSKRASQYSKYAKSRYRRDMAVARQLSIIVITDFLCWFPICIMGLMAQGGYLISNSAYAWSAVVILPINSAINPLLYTLRHVINDVIRKCHNRRNVRSNSNTSNTRVS